MVYNKFMVDKLFGSKTRYKLLGLFVSNPNRAFYVREITRLIDEQINSVRRELANLLSLGIITADSSDKHLYYEVNQKHEKYRSLVGLLADPAIKVASEQGKKGAITKMARKNQATKRMGDDERALGNVSLVVLSGIFTRDSKAPADLLIVGDVTKSSLDNYTKKLESSIDKEIKYVHFDQYDFDYRCKINDKFIQRMLGSKLSIRFDRNNMIDQPQSPTITKVKK